MTVNERISELRKLMARENIDAFLVPTDDFHSSEYVGEHFKEREFITGFTGSAGKAVVLAKGCFGRECMDDSADNECANSEKNVSSGLWVDGRYFLQAEAQLDGSEITLFKMEEPGVPKLTEFLADTLCDGACIGFDGRTITAGLFDQLSKAFEAKGKSFVTNSIDLIDEIWTERPPLSCEKAILYDEKYSGMSRLEKLKKLMLGVTEKKADMFILTALDDIAWLLNIRGADVACNPVILSYFVLDGTTPYLFVQKNAIKDIQSALEADGVVVREYNEVYSYIAEHSDSKTVIADREQINFEILRALSKNAKLVDQRNHLLIAKHIKNETEITNMKLAHIKDGVAKTKWIYWLKKNIGKIEMDEISVAEKLAEFRKAQADSRGDSFEPIMGYEEHGAIIHYSATCESVSRLAPKGFLLADTGGQYLEGTTDVTRTIALGEITDEQRKTYTAVLRGHLMLQGAQYKYGTTGSMLDDLARKPTEENGPGYNHGTGHGVGVYLNVHEDPVRITRKAALGDRDIVFEEGMITSNEPGIYLAGKFGVRIENLEVCKKAEVQDSDGIQMMCFEPLTMVPYDREALDICQMSEEEKRLYNEYQAIVCKTLSPYLDDEEREWLACETASIK